MIRSATIRFHRPINQSFTIAITRPRRGRASADVYSDDADRSLLASASLVIAPIKSQHLQQVAPEWPSVPPSDNLKRFAIPTGLVPIGQFLDVRPTDDIHPYAGGAQPVLTAWLRLTEDDKPPNPYRLIMLMDALAPSYAAILTTPQPVPTVELTVRCAEEILHVTSPWILLRATTTWASADGWLNEHLDAWDAAGTYLASADQLRTVSGSPTRNASSESRFHLARFGTVQSSCGYRAPLPVAQDGSVGWLRSDRSPEVTICRSSR